MGGAVVSLVDCGAEYTLGTEATTVAQKLVRTLHELLCDVSRGGSSEAWRVGSYPTVATIRYVTTRVTLYGFL